MPILSGFIACAIADRPGLVPGIVGGLIAVQTNAGFLGGIVTGLLGGFVARWISGWKVPKGVRGVMPVVVIPLLSTLITGGLFIIVLARPIAWLMTELNNWLNSMSGASAVILGVILGAMMGFDLGGPVNKVAYTFAITGLAAAGTATDAPQLKIMAAVMAAGMVAPLAMALATTLRPALFTEPERENGKAAWLLGASFISEGAIPFAAADPIRVIVSSVVGSAVTGALVMVFGCTLRAPHGGIWVLPLIGNPLLFLAGDRRRRGHHDGHRHRAQAVGTSARCAVRRRARGRCRLSRRHTPTQGDVMPSRTVTIASSVGLHARPAALFVQAANATGLDVEIARAGEEPTDATSILGVMALGAKHGEEVILTADGDGADEALDSLVDLLSRDLDAEE